MTYITWLFCLAILWITAADTEEEPVYPLVMAVYSKDSYEPKTLTDSKEANENNLKLPLDNKKPTFIALLCGYTDQQDGTDYFIVKQVVDKIDSIDKNLKCEHYLQANVRELPLDTDTQRKAYYEISFRFKVTEEILFKLLNKVLKEEAAGTESFKLLAEFTETFKLDSSSKSFSATSLEIRYDFERGMPISILHTVKAHMYSNTYEEECKEIDVRRYPSDENRPYKELVAQFKSKQVPSHHQWRQLVPMQDFKGIYTTQATCINLNYLVLHEKAINTLKKIESYIRMIADVINEVNVVTGTYTKEDNNSDLKTEKEESTIPEDNNSNPKTEKKENTIPTIVWKKIIHAWDLREYSILAIIHNKETERICSEKDALGWPDDNKNESEIGIGVMYYCLMNDNLSKILGLSEYAKPFNLREVPYKNKKIDVLERIITKLSPPKTKN